MSARDEEPIRRMAGRAARATLGPLYEPLLRGARELRRLLLGPELAIRTSIVPAGIRHRSGDASFDTGDDDLVVVCLVRDGEPWLEAFLDHYRALGARRFVFIDNDSVDATCTILAEASDDVTVFETSLAFRWWEFAIKRWMVHRFCGSGWVLLADIDEFLDYPRRSELSLRSFLRYLNAHESTAVAVQILDVFSDVSPRDAGREEDNRRVHRLCELDSIRHRRFARSGTARWYRSLRLRGADPGTWAGGLMQRAFGFDAPLTKMALLRPSRGVRLFDAHWARDAVLADVSAVFLHYRFVGGYLERVRRAVRLRNYWGGSTYHRWILEAIAREPEMRFAGPVSREYDDADDLVDAGYLAASERFMRWDDRGNESSG